MPKFQFCRILAKSWLFNSSNPIKRIIQFNRPGSENLRRVTLKILHGRAAGSQVRFRPIRQWLPDFAFIPALRVLLASAFAKPLDVKSFVIFQRFKSHDLPIANSQFESRIFPVPLQRRQVQRTPLHLHSILAQSAQKFIFPLQT